MCEIDRMLQGLPPQAPRIFYAGRRMACVSCHSVSQVVMREAATLPTRELSMHRLAWLYSMAQLSILPFALEETTEAL